MYDKSFMKELCEEAGILLETFSQGYVLRLSKKKVATPLCGGLGVAPPLSDGNCESNFLAKKVATPLCGGLGAAPPLSDGNCESNFLVNKKIRHILGSFWDINSAAADRIACDKCACYTLLTANEIPAIQHQLLNNPVIRQGWAKSTWAQALEYFEKHNQKVVVKPNQGSGGIDVFYCDNISCLEATIQKLFAIYPTVAISPFYKITTEYRVFYLNGKCHYIYGKIATNTWKHNLSENAKVIEQNKIQNKELLTKLQNMASNAATTIGINFASIDIAELSTGELFIMEINSGVQARRLVEQLPHLHDTIKNIYLSALTQMFEG